MRACNVYRGAHDAVGRIHRLAGVHADADPDRMCPRSVRCCLRGLQDRQAGENRLSHRREDNVERVALGTNLRTASLADHLAHYRSVPAEQLAGGFVTVPLREG